MRIDVAWMREITQPSITSPWLTRFIRPSAIRSSARRLSFVPNTPRRLVLSSAMASRSVAALASPRPVGLPRLGARTVLAEEVFLATAFGLGLIDFGALRVDLVEADLARLGGELGVQELDGDVFCPL